MVVCKNQLNNFPIEIDYPGANNYSQFSYDGLWRNRKIVETTSGSITSTKQFVWANKLRLEDRDAGSSVFRRFFKWGQTISGTSYFYSKPHLGSISEMTDGSGVVQARYSFDPYGRVTKLQGSLDSDFQFAGYYIHQRSGHFLTVLRAYNPLSGRWISRDPIEEAGGVNLYEYVENGPLSDIDPDGTATFVEFNIGDWIKKILEWLKKCIPSKPPKKPPEEPPGGGDGGAPPDDGDDGPPYEDPDKKKPGDDIPPDTKPKPDTVDENHDPWWMDDPWGKLPDKSGSDAPWWQDWKPFFGF